MTQSSKLTRPASFLTTLSLLGVAASMLLAGCSIPLPGNRVNGSGIIKTETRAVSGFSNIDLNGMGELVIQQTGTESLTIEADDNVLPYLTSDVRDGTLHLDVKPNTNLGTVTRLRYVLTVVSLTGIANNGIGRVTGEGISTDRIDVSVSGAGDVQLKGFAATQSITISGLGNVQLAELAGKTGQVSISGSGTARVNVSDTLDITISGLGNVEYLGDSVVKQQISGAGRVVKVGE